jgi:hypothetical protein
MKPLAIALSEVERGLGEDSEGDLTNVRLFGIVSMNLPCIIDIS